MQSSIKWVLLFAALSCGAQVPSSVPPMGWNSYYMVSSGTCAPTETIVHTQANAMKALLDARYNLVSVDCGWANQSRTGGLQTVNATNFPSGIPALVSYVHGQGQYIGLYSTPGPPSATNCGNGPGSYTFESVDANTFANWGIDYFKYDFCTGSTVYAHTTPGVESAYQVMGAALAGTAMPSMYYVASVPELSYGYGDGWTWFQTVGAAEYFTNEINNFTTLDNALFNVPWTTYQPFQNKGHWLNDDYLIACGHSSIFVQGGTQSVTSKDCQTQFAFFAMIASPLIVSADITMMDQTVTLGILNNAEVISVNQDSLGLMGGQFSNAACGSTNCPVWTRTLASGNIAVAFFNRDTSSHTISLTYNALGGASTYYTRDILAHTNLGLLSSYSTTVAGTGSAMLILSNSPINGSAAKGYVNGLAIQ